MSHALTTFAHVPIASSWLATFEARVFLSIIFKVETPLKIQYRIENQTFEHSNFPPPRAARSSRKRPSHAPYRNRYLSLY